MVIFKEKMFKKIVLSLFVGLFLSGCSLLERNTRSQCYDPLLHRGRNTITNSLGHEIFWLRTSIPIQIVIDPDTNMNTANRIRDAVFIWNTAVETELFQIAETPPENLLGTIRISEAYLGNVREGVLILGDAHRFYIRNIIRIRTEIHHAMIRLSFETPKRFLINVIIHELGHVLGLRHDCDPNSIMYRSMISTNQRIVAEDIYLIRRFLNSN